MSYQPCPLDEDEKIYIEGFTNAQWAQRVTLCIPLHDPQGCAPQQQKTCEKNKACKKYRWEGHGEHAKPMTGGVPMIRTAKDPDLAGAIMAEFQHNDGSGWKDSTVNHPSPPIRIGNYTQQTYITEDGGGPDQNDTCMFFRWFRGPLSKTEIHDVVFPANKTFYVRAFTNTDGLAQRIRITVPGLDEPLEYNGHQEGMEPMDGPASFTTGKEVTPDKQPKVEFFYLNEKGGEEPAFLSARRDDTLMTLHQFTWLARDEKATRHQTLVLCIYHWDT